MELLKKFSFQSILFGILVIQFQLDVSTESTSWERRFENVSATNKHTFHAAPFMHSSFHNKRNWLFLCDTFNVKRLLLEILNGGTALFSFKHSLPGLSSSKFQVVASFVTKYSDL